MSLKQKIRKLGEVSGWFEISFGFERNEITKNATFCIMAPPNKSQAINVGGLCPFYPKSYCSLILF